MKHILIVKMSSLGDIIHAFPVLQYIKQCEPNSQIDWVVEKPFAELVRAHPFVHQTLTAQTKKWRSQLLNRGAWQEIAHFKRELNNTRYDLVLDLQGNSKSGIITFLAKSPLKVGFGRVSVPEWPNLLSTHKKFNPPVGHNIREDYLFLAQKALGYETQNFAPLNVPLNLSEQEKKHLQTVLDVIKPIAGLKVLICAGSNWTNKQLSQETLQGFLKSFLSQLNAHFLFIWGNADEKKLVEEVALTLPQNSMVIPRLSLPALHNLMCQVDLVLSMDSLPLHLAGTTSTPTYSIFGPSSAQKYKPIGERHHAFQGGCPYGKTFEKRCVLLRTCKTGACMKDLQGSELFNHFYDWWSRLQKSQLLLL